MGRGEQAGEGDDLGVGGVDGRVVGRQRPSWPVEGSQQALEVVVVLVVVSVVPFAADAGGGVERCGDGVAAMAADEPVVQPVRAQDLGCGGEAEGAKGFGSGADRAAMPVAGDVFASPPARHGVGDSAGTCAGTGRRACACRRVAALWGAVAGRSRPAMCMAASSVSVQSSRMA